MATATTTSKPITTPIPGAVSPFTPGETISPTRLARWGSIPRFPPTALLASLHTYALETGFVEGTVYPLTFPYQPSDNVTFHLALDVLAATLARTTALFTASEVLSEADSKAVADRLREVREGLRFMLDQFLVLRPLRTDVQAGNIGRGVEGHWGALTKLEEKVLEKVMGVGKERAGEEFKEIGKMCKVTTRIFREEKWDKEEVEA